MKAYRVLGVVCAIAGMALVVPAHVCATDHCVAIATNETWRPSGNPHVVTCDLTVNSGVTLRLLPGVIVKFNGGLHLQVNGSLKAVGTSASPIVFTSYKDYGGAPAPGDWEQLVLNGAGGADSLVYCEIRYGGRNFPTSYEALSISGRSSKVVNSSIDNNYYHGVYVGGGAHPLLKNCQIHTNGGYAIRADLPAMPVWEGDYGSLAIYGNTYNGICTTNGTTSLGEDMHWHRMGYDTNVANTTRGIPYFVLTNDLIVPSGRTLRLDPGVNVRMGGALALSVAGSLKAVGTSASPIVFTSYKDYGGAPAPGDWEQLVLNGAGGADSLVYCEIRYGGRNFPTSYEALSISGRSSKVVNSSIDNNYYHGVYVGGGAHPLLKNCQIHTNGGYAIRADLPAMPVWEGDYGSLAIYGNTYNGICTTNGTTSLGEDMHWHRMGYDTNVANTTRGIPYFVLTNDLIVPSGRTLRLDPGVNVRMGGALALSVAGSLKAVGTSASPIVFTSYKDYGGAPAPGDWEQLVLNGAGGADSLVYCEIRYGGRNFPTSYEALSISGRSSKVVNSSIDNNYYHGVYVGGGAHPLLKNCQIHTNGGYAIRADLPAMPVWEGDYGSLAIYGNTYSGICITNGTTSLGEDMHWHRMGYDGSSGNTARGIPYFILTSDLQVSSGRTLRLDPGVDVRLGDDLSVKVVNATFEALGTVANPIQFTCYRHGAGAVAGDWGALNFSDAVVRMANCEIKYAGRVASTTYYAIEAAASTLELEQCTFANCYNGLIHVTNGTTARIWYSRLETVSTAIYGVNADATSTADARYCYWGHPTGPAPVGQGSRVSANVTYEPFWTEPLGPNAEIEVECHPEDLRCTTVPGYSATLWLHIHNKSTDCTLSYIISEGCFASSSDSETGVEREKTTGDFNNSGSLPSYVAAADVPWLTVSPTNGLVQAGWSSEVLVSIDATGLTVGVYTAFLIISSNDSEHNPLVRQVTVEVVGDPTGIGDYTVPITFALRSIFPNPFNPSTTVTFSTPGQERLQIRIYDVQGRLVRSLVDDVLPRGAHQVTWDGRNDRGEGVASGVYLVRFQGGRVAMSRKLVFVK